MMSNEKSTAEQPRVDCEQYHVTLSVSDLSTAIEFYTNKLGFKLDFSYGEPATLAGISLGSAQIFLSEGTPVPAGCSMHFVVGNVDEFYEFHRKNNVQVVSAPENQPYGLRDYSIQDLYGHSLQFGERLPDAAGPPIKVERVEITARMEKRLAALLEDLAAHKGMSVGSCLEETLLHTFESVGEPHSESVASPHTRRTLEFIQELKRKHRIDYDTHSSYRFEE